MKKKMNKKGFIIFTLAILILTIVICLLLWLTIGTSKIRDNVCKEMGFERYSLIGMMDYCEDSEGNLHYVKFKCDFPPFTKCEAKPISVGDVRTIRG